MNTKPENKKPGISRRDHLKVSVLVVGTLVVGALAAGGATSKYGAGNTNTPLEEFYPTHYATQRYSYFEQLPKFDPSTPLEANEMRITFMGSTFPMIHRAAAEMSVFVEVGWVGNATNGRPLDSFVFDIGCGASANYTSAGIDFARMGKIFLNHQHADHISDLIQVYSFGDGGTRKFPLYVWGNMNSGVTNPGTFPYLVSGSTNPIQGYANSPKYYNDGVSNMCAHLREALRWQTESQAFQSTAYTTFPPPDQIQASWGLPVLPVPVGDDPPQDANALIPIELDFTKSGKGFRADASGIRDNVAYTNMDTKATISHYPVIHTRKGAMGYKLEWDYPGRPASARPLTMVYASDTKPETNSIDQANNGGQGVDVYIHEMILAPEALTLRGAGLSEPLTNSSYYSTPYWTGYWSNSVRTTWLVEESAHTPQGAFGYMLSQINPRPRLAVATHFPVADDTVACALRSVQAHCLDIKKVGDQLVWSFDLMVLRVFPDRIVQCRAVGNDYAFATPASVSYDGVTLYAPKYHTETGDWDPWVQLDQSTLIPPTNYDGTINYREDGY